MLDPETRDEWVATLDLCIGVLPNEYKFHVLRVESIRNWLLGQESKNHTLPSKNDWQNQVFNWQEHDHQWRTDTPHGTVIITEEVPKEKSRFSVGVISRYLVMIQDYSGLIFQDYQIPEIDFIGAESRVRQLLTELETVVVEEHYLNHLGFTLHVCQHFLPPGIEAKHFLNLKDIEKRFWDVLP